jgi:hypothetical protein
VRTGLSTAALLGLAGVWLILQTAKGDLLGHLGLS